MGEVFTLVEKNNIDRNKVIEMFGSTLFSGPIYQNYGKNIAARNYTPVGFQMQLALKDIDLVMETAKQSQVPMPFASHLHDRLIHGLAKGRGDHDWMELTRGIGEDAGIE
jgi:3-hydroxyisobutyrate dehydrogenase-like beta-hydroxyacid dehydrogenase